MKNYMVSYTTGRSFGRLDIKFKELTIESIAFAEKGIAEKYKLEKVCILNIIELDN